MNEYQKEINDVQTYLSLIWVRGTDVAPMAAAMSKLERLKKTLEKISKSTEVSTDGRQNNG